MHAELIAGLNGDSGPYGVRDRGKVYDVVCLCECDITVEYYGCPLDAVDKIIVIAIVVIGNHHTRQANAGGYDEHSLKKSTGTCELIHILSPDPVTSIVGPQKVTQMTSEYG